MRTQKDHVKIEVFVSLGSRICDLAPLMEKVVHVSSRFKDFVEVQTKSIKSTEAAKHGLQDAGVIVDGAIKLSATFDEKDLEDAILKVKSDKERD